MRFILCGFLLWATSVQAQSGGNPEIFLMPLSVRGATVRVGTPVNVTNRPGYDNQPAFTRDGRHLYYTSTRADSQADIYRYDIATNTTERVTLTAPESEYSATPLPGSSSFSVIRVEKDSTQRLWSIAADGKASRVLFPGIKPVGYHAWIDRNHAVLFVLGSPNALVLADTRTGKGDTLARDIGRSLVALPSGEGFSFLARHGQEWTLTEVRTTRAGKVAYINPLAAMPRGMDYVAWIGGSAIGGSGSKLLVWTPGTTTWREVADLSAQGIGRISRIAVTRDLSRLAIVAEGSSSTDSSGTP